jgi:succinoglycan biosynthesis protein ExoV
MKLYHWRGDARNFGDELNTLLWPSLLPDFFDDDPREIFLGIGSVLDSRHRRDARKVVAGAGYGGYEAAARIDRSWTVHWVRGPRTAHRLGLHPSSGIGDPASLIDRALLAELLQPGPAPPCGTGGAIGFMPHFETAARGAWQRVATLAGITFIDPRDDPRAVLAAIAGCRLLLSEALHGVIVADALRVPWIAVSPFAPIHTAKWQDWSEAMSIAIDFAVLPPSSFAEQLRVAGLGERQIGRTLLDRGERRLQGVAADRFADRAAAALRRAAEAPQHLTDSHALDRSRDRMHTALNAVRRNEQPHVALAS